MNKNISHEEVKSLNPIGEFASAGHVNNCSNKKYKELQNIKDTVI